MKSEPVEFSITDLKKEKRARWGDIRNYQVRNMIRDEIQVGDIALFYHSNAAEIGVVGEMTVIQLAYTDPTQFDSKSNYFDSQSKKDNPRWLALNVQFLGEYPRVVTLTELKSAHVFKNSPLTLKGNRLSIIPISPAQYDYVRACAVR
jgi:predicted RNA-binding protein with PUA-like domain